eukprot:scaffold1650_cov124-Isochrysis_galbana.AAC.11
MGARVGRMNPWRGRGKGVGANGNKWWRMGGGGKYMLPPGAWQMQMWGRNADADACPALIERYYAGAVSAVVSAMSACSCRPPCMVILVIKNNSARAWRGHDGAARSSFGWSPLRWFWPRTKVLRVPA